MIQQSNNSATSARSAAIARRQAMSRSGKSAVAANGRTRAMSAPAQPAAKPAANRAAMAPAANGNSARQAALARRKAMSTSGKSALAQTDRSRSSNGTATNGRAKPQPAAPVAARPTAAPQPARTPQRPRQFVRPPAVKGNSTREAALARRKAMSSRGKVAAKTADRVRNSETFGRAAAAKANTNSTATPAAEAKPAQPARRPARSNATATTANRIVRRTNPVMAPGRAASLARRRAQSTRGKAGLGAAGISTAQAVRTSNPDMSGRELARALRAQRSQNGRAGKKKCVPSGRQRRNCRTGESAVRAAQDQSWKVGASETSHGQTVTGTQVGRKQAMTGDEASTCRNITGTEYMGADIFRDFCQTEPGPSVMRGGMSATSTGNAVTGNRVGRSEKVTGDEPGTCKLVTGTEYLGAEQSQSYCGTAPQQHPAKVVRGETPKQKPVTGSLVLRSERVTGNETGFDRQLTGTPYTQLSAAGAPPKVQRSSTLHGGAVTGTYVGRRDRMTGDEMGSCRNVTGDDYASLEQFQSFCNTAPERADRKVGRSSTMTGETVTGTMTGHSGKVTGDEPGTCKAITGTPYAGLEQYGEFCAAPQTNMAMARMYASKRAAGAPMTGIQPGVGGVMTGAERGACETVSGTPYVGDDQQAAVCNRPRGAAPRGTANGAGQARMNGRAAMNGRTAMNGAAMNGQAAMAANGAANGQAMQAVNGHAVNGQMAANGQMPTNGQMAANGQMPTNGQLPWEDFSTNPPIHASDMLNKKGGVTGNGYEAGHITGPFGMAAGKVTGTEEARFGRPPAPVSEPAMMPQQPEQPAEAEGRVKSRITGEGQDAGLKITGDDWDLGSRVSGTVGRSAEVRNPTLRGGPATAMAMLRKGARNEDVPAPVSKVTGSSGNTDAGALITYSGGARG